MAKFQTNMAGFIKVNPVKFKRLNKYIKAHLNIATKN